MTSRHAPMPLPRTSQWTWNTDNTRKEDRFDYHREEVCRALMPVTPQPPERREFHSRGEVLPVGAGAVMRLQITGQYCERTSGDIAKAGTQGYHLNTLLAGSPQSHSLDGGRSEFVLEPGKSLLFPSGTRDRYDSDHLADMELGSFWLPHDALQDRLGARCDMAAVMVSDDQVTGPLITAVERALLTDFGSLAPGVTVRLFDVLLDLVALALNSHCEIAEPSPKWQARELLLRQEIGRQLRREGLQVRHIAAKLGVSPRNIHKLFERSGETFSSYVLERRLIGASIDLRNHAFDGVGVTQIALSWGFADASHFSRSFRQKFGCSPSAWRKDLECR